MLPLIIAENTEASSATQLNITLQLQLQTNNPFQAGADWPLGAPGRYSTQGRRGTGQKKQLNVEKLLTCSASSAGQFHL